MSNWIAFTDVKSFYVRVYRRLRTSLALRPLVVVRDGQVLEACGLAQAEGVSTGIPLRQVRCLCPRVEIITFNPDDCLLLYRQIWDVVADHSPVVEPTDFHQGFADITKVVSDTHQAQEWCSQIKEQIRQQTELKSSIGIGPSRFVARVAARQDTVVAEEDSQQFLAPVSVASLGWLDSDLIQVLQRLGLTTLGQVAAVDKNTLIQQVGRVGGRLHDWVNGKDSRPTWPLHPPPEERAAHTFTMEDREEVIIQTLGKLCAQLADRLWSTTSQAQRLTLRIEDETGCQAYTQQYSHSLKDARRLYRAAAQLLRQLWRGQP